MERGPDIYENWKAAHAGAPVKREEEYTLFTDAVITGQIGGECGPYMLLNTVPTHPALRPPPECMTKRSGSGRLSPSIVLRAAIHADYELPPLNKSDTKHYHGGYLCDEMAALVSLSLGIRLQAGPMTREFSPGDDPKGRPAGPRYRLDPVLSAQAASGILIPNALRDHNLNHEIHSLKRLNELSAEDATALVHAARSYQEAIWIADSDPALSWLMFVTAAEIAAKNWKKESYTPLDKLQTSRPVFAGWLRTEVEDHVLQRVAEEFAVYAGVTKKFIEFLIHFLPEPPEERARIEGCRCSWSEEDMRDYMGVIYHHRSRALHDGIPFPWPMWCPHPFDPRAEKPCGEGCSGMGGSWTTKDTPMVLWTFEYIVRNALLKWWAKMLPEDRSS